MTTPSVEPQPPIGTAGQPAGAETASTPERVRVVKVTQVGSKYVVQCYDVGPDAVAGMAKAPKPV